MSFGILQSIWNRLHLYKNIAVEPESLTMRQFEMMGDEQYKMVEFNIVEKERRPMIEVPAYIEKFKKNEELSIACR